MSGFGHHRHLNRWESGHHPLSHEEHVVRPHHMPYGLLKKGHAAGIHNNYVHHVHHDGGNGPSVDKAEPSHAHRLHHGITRDHERDNASHAVPRGSVPDQIRDACKHLGLDDQRTDILVKTAKPESGYDKDQWGGDGGRYYGLWQFGPEERADYGLRVGASVPEQTAACVRYMTDRFAKHGMDFRKATLVQGYAAILSGDPHLVHAKDSNGTSAAGTFGGEEATHGRHRGEAHSAPPAATADQHRGHGRHFIHNTP